MFTDSLTSLYKHSGDLKKNVDLPLAPAPLNPLEIKETLSVLDDWEMRYAYILDLRKSLPDMPAALKIDAHKISGCVSQVWIVPLHGQDQKFDFLADSDSHIVRGLIAILRAVYTQEDKQAVSKDMLDSMGLAEHLSPNRRNGFSSMVGYLESVHSLK